MVSSDYTWCFKGCDPWTCFAESKAAFAGATVGVSALDFKPDARALGIRGFGDASMLLLCVGALPDFV
jgi:hypothetical protein